MARTRTAAPAVPVVSRISADLLAWYDRHRRDLPWRAKPGQDGDPYRIWLSEIMLQQTTVAAVKAYYTRFLERWPDVQSLAAAPVEAVMQAWAGLGYYSRARNLHACAKVVTERHGGRFPREEAALLKLPGIGPYTAAAIASIAFGQRAVVVDGNVERVMARIDAIDTPMPAAKPLVRAAMDAVTPATRTGDFAQAMMDLGATLCTPRSPACVICPLSPHCSGRRSGDPSAYPKKLQKRAVPLRAGAVFVIASENGEVLVRTRPPTGLFGGMTEFPGTAWTENFDGRIDEALPSGIVGPMTDLGEVHHVLTHFSLTLRVYSGISTGDTPVQHRWVDRTALDAEALPTLMRKVLALATGAGRTNTLS